MVTDPLDDMPKIRLEKDDLESFHRTRAQKTNKSSKKSNLPNKSPSTSNSPSWLAILFLLTAIIGAAGYWSFEQFKVLQQAQSRITELESRLSATGENMDQSTAALQIKVSELITRTEDLWVQMDKLWASAWRRNQTEIGALNKTVMSLKASTEQSAKNLSANAANNNAETANNNTTIGLVKEQLENQAGLLKQLSDGLKQISNIGTDFEQQLASLREKLISTALVNNDLTNQIDDLRLRILAAEKKANEIKVLPVKNVIPI